MTLPGRVCAQALARGAARRGPGGSPSALLPPAEAAGALLPGGGTRHLASKPLAASDPVIPRVPRRPKLFAPQRGKVGGARLSQPLRARSVAASRPVEPPDATVEATADNIRDLVNLLRLEDPTKLTLRQIAEFGKRVNADTGVASVRFLKRELSIRLAHALNDLEGLPSSLLFTAPVQIVREYYRLSFLDMLNFPEVEGKEDPVEYVNRFTTVLKHILIRHRNIVVTLAQGVIQMKKDLQEDTLPEGVQEFLDRFYLMRISMRVLMNQHCELFKHWLNPNEKQAWRENGSLVGVVEEDINVRSAVEDAAENGRFLISQYYGVNPPEVQIVERNGLARFPYVPSHLFHMCSELLKNSLRATVEHHGVDFEFEGGTYPPVKVVIVKGDEDATIKVSDEGGGIPRSEMDNIWTYLYTTAETPTAVDSDHGGDPTEVPLAGLGYGLPLSRVYARYFGGDLNVISMEGYGTDCYLHLKMAACEVTADELAIHYPQ